MTDDGFILGPLSGIAEARAAAAFQERIWGPGFSERVPASLLLVLPRVGSVAIAAYPADDPGRMVGFVFGVTGVEEGEVVHWSDILGIDPEFRDRGLGRRLKQAQREAAIAAGVVRMYWTFDPLEARNAWMNVHHLGAGARSYEVDMYGEPDSPLHRGIGTDRLVARWELTEPSTARASGEAPGPLAFHPVERADGGWDPGDVQLDSGPRLRIPIPADIQAIMTASRERAALWRASTRAAFVVAFAAGASVVGIERAPWGLSYRLAPCGPLHPEDRTGELPA